MLSSECNVIRLATSIAHKRQIYLQSEQKDMIHNKRHVTTFRTARESLWDRHWVRMYGVVCVCVFVLLTGLQMFHWPSGGRSVWNQPIRKAQHQPPPSTTQTGRVFTTNGPRGKQNAAPRSAVWLIFCQLQFVIWAQGHSDVHPEKVYTCFQEV